MDAENKVTILMVYASGIQRMLKVTLNALSRHVAGCSYKIKMIVDKGDEDAIKEIREVDSRVEIVSYDIGVSRTASGQHSRLLDKAVLDVDTSHFLTMDSDCFPVADGWLKALMDMQVDDVAASGILWPWVPPPKTIGENTIEWRIRKYHCWNNIHPACQLIRTRLMIERGWKFGDSDGDDVNHGFMEKARVAGYRTIGLMPTRGPLVDPDFETPFDPEDNRLESLIFGDMVYHHVGATRECRGYTSGKSELFTKSRERVYNECGAEWMLIPGNSHIFKFDREEAVAQVKMEMVWRTATIFLENHSSLFSKDWAE